MKKIAVVCFAGVMLFAFLYAADEPLMVLDTKNHPVIGEIIRLDPRFDKLIPATRRSKSWPRGSTGRKARCGSRTAATCSSPTSRATR